MGLPVDEERDEIANMKKQMEAMQNLEEPKAKMGDEQLAAKLAKLEEIKEEQNELSKIIEKHQSNMTEASGSID